MLLYQLAETRKASVESSRTRFLSDIVWNQCDTFSMICQSFGLWFSESYQCCVLLRPSQTCNTLGLVHNPSPPFKNGKHRSQPHINTIGAVAIPLSFTKILISEARNIFLGLIFHFHVSFLLVCLGFHDTMVVDELDKSPVDKGSIVILNQKGITINQWLVECPEDRARKSLFIRVN